MGKNKLKKFADMARFRCVLQYPREELLRLGFPYSGKWNEDIFSTAAPIVLELDCVFSASTAEFKHYRRCS